MFFPPIPSEQSHSHQAIFWRPVAERCGRLAAALCALFLVLLTSPAGAAGFPKDLRIALQKVRVPLSDVGIWVSPVDNVKRPTLAHNPDLAMNPASVMKLVTAFATLDRLGPAYFWTTRLAMDGEIKGNTLNGNLYLIGGGDPVFTHADLWKLFRQLRGLGIERVQGNIVIDDSALRLPAHHPGRFDGQALRPYNAGPSGMLINFNAMRLTFVPEPEALPAAAPALQLVSSANAAAAPSAAAAARPPRILIDPPLARIDIDNALESTAGRCAPRWYKKLDATPERTKKGVQQLRLSGKWHDDCGVKDWYVAPVSPRHFTEAVVAGLWSEMGGRLNGRIMHARAPLEAATLFVHTSRPLADVVRDMNKWSNNVIARQLLATLGASESSAPEMVTGGARLARIQLAAAGVDVTGLEIDNGAGLSRTAKITSRGLGQMLHEAWKRPFMPEFISSMAVAGVDGTARKRLSDSPASGSAHIKTGTLNNVRAMAGYVIDRKGERHIVVMMVNHANAGATRVAQDILLEWVWEGR